MASGQATVTFGALDRSRIQGGEFTVSRGVSPSSARLFFDPSDVAPTRLGPMVGTLKFEHDGRAVAFTGAALAPQSLRLYRGRDAWCWSVQVMDRRWRWRYPRISGSFNQRGCDGAIVESTRQTLAQLLRRLLDALGEPGAILSSIPAGIFPAVTWDAVRADLELADMAERHGLVPFMGTDDRAHVEPLGSGASLSDSIDAKMPRWRYAQSVLPANIEVHGGPTLHQQAISLRPVGLDVDGRVKPINDLSYVPAEGWGRSWFSSFSDVPIGVRHLAFKSVWRWFEPEIDSIIADIPVVSLRQLKLLQTVAEAPANDDGIVRCGPPQVRGVYWPQSDLAKNTTVGTPYAGDFEIDADKWLVKFEYPVVSTNPVVGIIEPVLELVTAFHLDGPDGLIRPVALRPVGGSGPNRIDIHSHVRDVRNDEPLYGPVAEAPAQARDELDAIAQAIAAGHQGTYASEVYLDGIRKVDLTGRIAQVHFRCGVQDTRGAFTRASENMEFDVFVPHHQERRRRETVSRLAGRMR